MADGTSDSEEDPVATTTGIAVFESILGRSTHGPARAALDEDAIQDLALAKIVEPLAEHAPHARAAFLTPLSTPEQVSYRHDVFRCLESDAVLRAVTAFHTALLDVHARRTGARAEHQPQRAARLHLGAVLRYTDAVLRFRDDLPAALDAGPHVSDALAELAAYVRAYVDSPGFAEPAARARELADTVNALRYSMLIRGAQVLIAADAGDADLTEAVESTFSRFRQGEAASQTSATMAGMFDHVQGWVLEKVAQLNPQLFADLVAFAHATLELEDAVLHRFEQEIPFYLAFRDYVAPLTATGLPLSYPTVSADRKALHAVDGWDMALASVAAGRGAPVVTNDLELRGAERILVVSGPNQGGKTTTARLFGQLHHLASIGCPVPAREASVFLGDRVLTLFDREEDGTSDDGRLGTEVARLHDLLAAATPDSVIVLNELFSSTALVDARLLTRDALERISALDCLAICVSFIDELSRLNEKTVSMVGLADPLDPARRTFRVERRPADGRAYAAALARKHGLTAAQLDRRIGEAS